MKHHPYPDAAGEHSEASPREQVGGWNCKAGIPVTEEEGEAWAVAEDLTVEVDCVAWLEYRPLEADIDAIHWLEQRT